VIAGPRCASAFTSDGPNGSSVGESGSYSLDFGVG
jgi:hypothetical protein